MGRFGSTKSQMATDKVLQDSHNKLCDLLDERYYVQKTINGKNIEVTVSPQVPFELKIDGRKHIYVNPETGVLVPSIYDLNEDGYVDVDDMKLLKDYILGVTSTFTPRMDINGDGDVDAVDLTLWYRGASVNAIGLDTVEHQFDIDYLKATLTSRKTYSGTPVQTDVSNHNGFAYAHFMAGDADSVVGTHVIDMENTDIPANAIITGGTVHVTSAVTSGGAATVALGLNGTGGATNSIMNATAVGSLTTNAMFNSKTTFAAPVKVTSESQITITVATANLTNGEIEIFLQYFLLD